MSSLKCKSITAMGHLSNSRALCIMKKANVSKQIVKHQQGLNPHNIQSFDSIQFDVITTIFFLHYRHFSWHFPSILVSLPLKAFCYLYKLKISPALHELFNRKWFLFKHWNFPHSRTAIMTLPKKIKKKRWKSDTPEKIWRFEDSPQALQRNIDWWCCDSL